MGFLQPALLAGALFLAVPVVLHLIHRQKYPPVRFSTLDFFGRTVKHNTLQKRLIDVLLLLLRLAALACLVLACARPFWPSDSGTASAAAVLVIDNSGSMNIEHRPGEPQPTAFSAAQQRALEILDSLKPGDRVAVLPTVLPGGRSLADRALSYDLAGARAQIQNLNQEFLPGHMTESLRSADRLLRSATELRRHLVLFCDGHARDWRESPSLQGLPASVTLYHFPIASQQGLAITSVTLSDQPAAAGLPVQISVVVRNFGDKPSGPVKVELVLHSARTFPPKTIRDIPAGEERVADFTHVFLGRDLEGGRASLVAGDDPYTDDNTFFIVPQVQDVVRALLVNGVESPRAADRASYFLARALQPAAGESDSGGLSPVIVDDADLSQLPQKIFYDYGAVLTANIPAFPEKSLPKFKDYVRNGGAWLAFLGDQADLQAYNDMGVLPGRLKVRHHPPLPVVLDRCDLLHPALAYFAEPGHADLTLFSFSHYYEFEPGAEDTTRVLAEYSDGRPALVEGRYGLGRVLVFTSSCSTDWTDMPLRPTFLVLAQRLVGYLGSRGDGDPVRSQVTVREALFEPKPEGPFAADRVFLGPDLEVIPRRALPKGHLSEGPRRPGIYYAQPAETLKVGGLVLDRRPYAVNASREESEPGFWNVEQVQQKLGVEAQVVENPFQPAGESGLPRGGFEYFPALFAALLAVLVAESLVGWRVASESG
ncbi:MAG: BatA domain-containing protein [Planctomycetes bacterium]|nr:BatA domain-containing protein [Planctomycetota bacterium]